MFSLYGDTIKLIFFLVICHLFYISVLVICKVFNLVMKDYFLHVFGPKCSKSGEKIIWKKWGERKFCWLRMWKSTKRLVRRNWQEIQEFCCSAELKHRHNIGQWGGLIPQEIWSLHKVTVKCTNSFVPKEKITLSVAWGSFCSCREIWALYK